MSALKKVAMIMLVGLLVAGPIVPPHAVAQGGAYEKAESAAHEYQDRATQAYNQMVTNMKSMSGMSLTANEKAMMKQMGTAAGVIKNLIDDDTQILEALRQLHNK